MILLQAEHIEKTYGIETILQDISLQIQTGERVGLVGVNGAGKSTLMKILAGELSYDSGLVRIPKDVTVGYLAQNGGLESERCIWDELLSVFDHLRAEEKELRELEAKMGDPAVLADEKRYQQILENYSLRSEAFKEKGGYSYEGAIRGVLHGLRFADMDYQTPIKTLSGGQKTRLALAKLLLQSPTILLLDEPTNYLDIETLTWLETYLQNYQGAILVVSHDRYFLDKLVTVVYEIERTRATRYVGNYSRFLDEKAARLEQDLKRFEKQQEEIAKLEDFIARNIARATTTKRAQSRRKTLEKMDRLDKPIMNNKSVNFSFEVAKMSGTIVMKASNLSVGYPDAVLSRGLTFEIEREERVALVGPNGIGKSTLLKTIVGQLQALAGDVHFGSNVTIGYYDQEHRNLNERNTVLGEIWDEYPNMLEKDVRTLLGNFLFSGDDVQKKISDLSGGERARVSLAKLMLKQANFLIFDEPTNHLDIFSKEVLENALYDYPGTILFVSHDRYFLNKIASRVLELTGNGVTSYLGNYDYYVEKKQELEELAAEQAAQPAKKQGTTTAAQAEKSSYELDKEAKRRERQRQRRLEEIEATIQKREADIVKWEEELCLPEIYSDHMQAKERNDLIQAAKQELEQLYDEWSSLSEE
ncbi:MULTISPECIES: ABC-F family ATP-binding cassette domain-containing protein [Brevibacillus]|jgi:ATP-binding cassette subfamily F protein 3|uniref:ABC transporter ATP-binding protein n=1 Tax=Brevibacillus parabrevis TaxID=54914 RepID=A0A4Y3PQS4_BREPA|nr:MULTISPECIES: ABC-F family ATP-binding cassette domain-containing protein [Brevibacillus]MDH6353597.1 ATP-binding cassette subfamily F protein 3 [Brevibacillus sp. 1238]MDR5001774.1 ABC-F family ATP-binding cassette domain-containing protein [Brevibacillus parabrevis]NRQ56879.1 ABC-F family ATP-binding cassette domain-containing protein [Brevibacillus sp. HD1.4A]RNB92079.1 ABC transporter ATP-binding protein [Brevibacillus parabrevis]UED69675.1 ABC-F family ATP-binding cassette domain-conta